MIQRLQTIWLLLACACIFAGFRFPYFSGTDAKNISDATVTASSTFLIMVTTIVAGGLAFFTIFLYKRRRLQVLLCVLGILLEAWLIYLYYSQSKTYIKGNLAFTAILQGCAVFFFFIAARAISRDEKIVKESDRLR